MVLNDLKIKRGYDMGTRFKFRAECIQDVVDFLETLPGDEIVNYSISGKANPFPEMECIIELTTFNLMEVRSIMREISDGHVMEETVQLEKNYTGERHNVQYSSDSF